MTPSGTPVVPSPRAPASLRPWGELLAAPVRILGPFGPYDLEVNSNVTIGRDPSCDIVLNDPLASRRHAKIVATLDGVVIGDLSRNGVYINCVRVQGMAYLHAGDRILLGTTEVSVFSPRSS